MALTGPEPGIPSIIYCHDCDDNHEEPECDILGDLMDEQMDELQFRRTSS